MKKFLAGIAAAAIITIPMTSFALESMSKGALKKATAQAGVSIAVDNVVIAQTLPTTTYWDTDGWILGSNLATGTTINGGVTKAGISIGYEGTNGAPHKLITLNAIVDNTFGGGKYNNDSIKAAFQSTEYTTSGTTTTAAQVGVNAGVMDQGSDYVNNTDITGTTPGANYGKVLSLSDENNMVTRIAPLTIDVGTCKSLSDGITYNKNMLNTALNPASVDKTYAQVGVVIGLPTVEIGITENKDALKVIKVKGVAAAGTTLANAELAATTTAQYDNEIIAIQQEGTKKIAILGGRVEISAH